jgi:hypothetical protein
MSWRIEDPDALTVLRELPSGWAQSCVTRPPRDVPVATLLAVLAETRRVLRSDGTLWLALSAGGTSSQALSYLRETAWLSPGRRAVARAPRGVLLFTKHPEYLFHPRPALRSLAERRFTQRAGARGRGCESCRSPRRAFCVSAPGIGGFPRREVIEWCVLSSTITRACGICGAPWQPVGTAAGRWKRPGRACVHLNWRGRSLVIDPFCESATAAAVAQLHGRDFLGIARSPDAAAAIRGRLMLAGREARR